MTTPASLPARLRAARMAARGGAGIGQSELAAVLGVSQATISDYERGRRRPSLAVLTGLARVLGVSPAWLLEETALDPAECQGQAAGPVGSWRAQPVDRNQLVLSRLADVLGVAVISSLGSAALYSADRGVRWAATQPAAVGSEQQDSTLPALAAESRPAYGATRLTTAGQQLVLDSSLTPGVDCLVTYAGPASEQLQPGSVLLISRTEPGVSVCSPLFPDLQVDWLLFALPGTHSGGQNEVYVVTGPGKDSPPAPAKLLGRVRAIITPLQ